MSLDLESVNKAISLSLSLYPGTKKTGSLSNHNRYMLIAYIFRQLQEDDRYDTKRFGVFWNA